MIFVFTLCFALTQGLSETTLYPENYEDSRQRFQQASQHLLEKYPSAQLRSHILDSKEDLTIESLYLPSNHKASSHLIIITTGLHGIEAFAGSALLLGWMQRLEKNQLKNSYLLVHAVNPWGFKYQRRVTESNVDLNRNLGREDFTEVNDIGAFDDFLNPKQPVRSGFFSDLRLFLKSLWYLYQHGRQKLTQIAIGGQYQQPLGIYYGGQSPEPHKKLLQKLWRETSHKYHSVLHLDIHTGYGERGRLHFFANAKDRDQPEFSELFKGFHLDFEDDKNFYETSGSFDEFTKKTLEDKNVTTMTLEFGTLDSQTLLGGFASLRNMIQENQAFHHGGQSPQDVVKVKNRFRDMFAPQEPKWQKAMLEQGLETLKTLDSRFSQMPQATKPQGR